MQQNPLLLAILAVLSGCGDWGDTRDGTGCLDVPATQSTCASKDEVGKSQLYVAEGSCGDEITAIKGDGKRVERWRQSIPGGPAGPIPSCCYPVEITHHDAYCGTPGRPYFEAGRALLAPMRASAALSGRELRPSAEAWARAGAAEHASVAAFSRLALELMALGAPNALLRDVHQAALDEVGHADACWALARANGYAELCAAPFPIREVKLASSLAELAAAAVREGCLAETLGAEVTRAIAELAATPEAQVVLGTIAREEAVHAVLSFRIVAWALQVGGADVRAAVHAALAEPWPELDTAELALRAGVSPAVVAEAAERAVAEVLMPAATQLLAA